MRVEFIQSNSFSTHLNFKAKNIKSNVSADVRNRFGQYNKIFSIKEKFLAAGTALFAFFKGRTDNKIHDDIKQNEEIDDIDKKTEKLKQEIEKLNTKIMLMELEVNNAQNSVIDNAFVQESLFPQTHFPEGEYIEFEEIQAGAHVPFPDTSHKENYQEEVKSTTKQNDIEDKSITDSIPLKAFTAASNDEFANQVKEFQENYVKKMQALARDLESLQSIKTISNIHEMLSKIDKIKGFERIQGYDNIKTFFKENYINPVQNHDEKNIPNVILMYGAQGTGKTLFAHELGHEADSNYIKQKVELDTNANINNLISSLQKSAEEYKANGKRTIIHIDEIDIININDKKSENALKELLNEVSEKYHATIVGTTNYFKHIDSSILKADKFKSLYLPPPKEEDIAEILKFICQYIAEPSVDYNKAAKQIMAKAGNDYYSSARIYKFAQNFVSNYKDFSQKISQQDLTEAINNDLPDADIAKADLNTN